MKIVAPPKRRRKATTNCSNKRMREAGSLMVQRGTRFPWFRCNFAKIAQLLAIRLFRCCFFPRRRICFWIVVATTSFHWKWRLQQQEENQHLYKSCWCMHLKWQTTKRLFFCFLTRNWNDKRKQHKNGCCHSSSSSSNNNSWNNNNNNYIVNVSLNFLARKCLKPLLTNNDFVFIAFYFSSHFRRGRKFSFF